MANVRLKIESCRFGISFCVWGGWAGAGTQTAFREWPSPGYAGMLACLSGIDGKKKRRSQEARLCRIPAQARFFVGVVFGEGLKRPFATSFSEFPGDGE